MEPHLDTQGLLAFAQYLDGAAVFLEYGSGGSTVLAAKSGVKTIISIDSNQKWIEAVKREAKGARASLFLIHCDIGPTGQWGYPADGSGFRNYPAYVSAPWQVARQRNLAPRLILVDGRFRVACFLYSLIHAQAGAVILFDDYADRPAYHVVERFCPIREMRGRMAVFCATGKSDIAPAVETLMKYCLVPD